MTESKTVFLCDPEWCDGDGFHWSYEPFAVYKIDIRPNDDMEWSSGDMSFLLIPASENLVHEIVGYKFPCGTWFAIKPEEMTVDEAIERVKSM